MKIQVKLICNCPWAHCDYMFVKKEINKYPLFTLGSVYSTKASGAEQILETNSRKLNITRLKTPTGRRQTSWLFTSVAEELNSGVP